MSDEAAAADRVTARRLRIVDAGVAVVAAAVAWVIVDAVGATVGLVC